MILIQNKFVFKLHVDYSWETECFLDAQTRCSLYSIFKTNMYMSSEANPTDNGRSSNPSQRAPFACGRFYPFGVLFCIFETYVVSNLYQHLPIPISSYTAGQCMIASDRAWMCIRIIRLSRICSNKVLHDFHVVVFFAMFSPRE